jgi:ABC-type lipoprotein export system ATPase subunit
MVTHDAELARRMSRVITMTDGQIVSDFTGDTASPVPPRDRLSLARPNGAGAAIERVSSTHA